MAVEPNTGLASACTATGHECAPLNGVEGVKPAVQVRVRRFMRKRNVSTTHVHIAAGGPNRLSTTDTVTCLEGSPSFTFPPPLSGTPRCFDMVLQQALIRYVVRFFYLRDISPLGDDTG